MKNNYSKVYLAFSFNLFVSLFCTENLSAKSNSPAADCGCTITLPAASDGGIYYNGSSVKPGSKVCIAAGTYKHINLFNFKGTAAAPIEFVNCGGQVIVTGNTYGFSITNSVYFHLSGAGTPGVTYGFKTTGGSTYSVSGFGVGEGSSDFTVDHVEVHKANVGVICKKNPTCDASTWQGAFTMRNVVFHDMYVHDVTGEGFYVGHTSSVVSMACNGQTINVLPQVIRGLKIYNNRVESTGWDGIQVASTPENAEIYNNTVLNFGTANHSSQKAGILLGGMSAGKVYNNFVANGTGNGIQILGSGYVQVTNNVVVNVGGNNVESDAKDGIFIDDRPIAGYPSLYVTVCNNTIVSPKRTGVRMENTHKTITNKSEFHNNLVVASGEPNADFTTIAIRNNAPNSSTNNLYYPAVSSAKFVGSADYHLSASSPTIDAGVAVSPWGVLTDKDGLNRSMGARPDVGAYEYPGVSAPATNDAPDANAGADKVITLPVNSVPLSGSGTDTDGSIIRYSWTKISGPTQFSISNSGISNPTISNLVAGTYVLRLTVTDNANATGYNDMTVKVDPSSAETPLPNTKVIPGTIEAEKFDAMYGIKVENTKDAGGGTNVAGVHKRDWIEYNVSVTATGTYTVNLRVASFVNTAQLQILSGSSVLTTVNVPNTGGYQTWRTITASVSLQAGVQTLRVYSSGPGAWFLNWMQFSSGTATASAGTGEISNMTSEDASGSYSAKVQDQAFSSKASFNVFPNPVTTAFTLNVSNGFRGSMRVQLVDISGHVRKEYNFEKNQQLTQLNIPANELPAGVYFIQAQIGNWKDTKKFVKL